MQEHGRKSQTKRTTQRITFLAMENSSSTRP